jgi:ERCC4-type nuclease
LSSVAEKKLFMKTVCIITDTREQKNGHITGVFDSDGIMHEERKLDYGDYSFSIDGHDFSGMCVIERKANPDEVYSNITSDRERIEKELDTASKIANQLVFLIENVSDWQTLRSYAVPEHLMEGRKVQNIGETCYSTLQAWKCGNRYNFTVEFVPDEKKTAYKILEIFYWYWHNYKKLTGARK